VVSHGREPGDSPLDPELRERLRAAPKVELHLHLDGAMSHPWLLERVRRRTPAPLTSLDELTARLAFDTFEAFIRAWVWKCGFLDRYADFESLAESVLEALAARGVVHVDASVSPGDYARNSLETAGILEAVLRGGERATAASGIGFGLLVDLIRDHGPAVAERRLEEITPYRGQGVVGIGLGGSEGPFPPGPFAAVYAEAARRGFHRAVHAGEAAGPASIHEALATLDPERIGHGVRAVEDPALLDRLARTGMPLEVCVTSNVRTGVVASYAAHPLRRLLDAGVRVTLNSDDPTFFGTDLLDEMELCLARLGVSPRELAAMSEHAAAAAFLDDAARARLVARVREGWAGLI